MRTELTFDGLRNTDGKPERVIERARVRHRLVHGERHRLVLVGVVGECLVREYDWF